MFLTQAFIITQLFDSSTEQGTDGLGMLSHWASVTAKQPSYLNGFIMKNLAARLLSKSLKQKLFFWIFF